MAERVTVRKRIHPAITASLFANYRSSADAVIELVDNACDSRIKSSLLEVLLQVHSSDFVIESRGGGMGPTILAYQRSDCRPRSPVAAATKQKSLIDRPTAPPRCHRGLSRQMLRPDGDQPPVRCGPSRAATRRSMSRRRNQPAPTRSDEAFVEIGRAHV